ncbi:MAG: hypothetical protein ACP5SQ_08420 [Candidatus Saccharicenans sp.]
MWLNHRPEEFNQSSDDVNGTVVYTEAQDLQRCSGSERSYRAL